MMLEGANHPIFYDEKQRRWRRFKRTVGLLSFAFVTILGMTIGSVLINPALPRLSLEPMPLLSQENHSLPPYPSSPPPGDREPSLQKASAGFFDHLLKVPPTEISTAMSASGAKQELIAFYVNWDYTSFLSLEENLFRLDKLIPEWLHLTKADGTIDLDDPIKQDEVLSYIRQHRPSLSIIPLINNFNNHMKEWDGSKLAKMLGDPVARRRTIQNLLDFVHSNGFPGICIDFENVPWTSQSMRRVFMQELYAQFHPLGLEVIQTVPLRDPTFDYRKGAEFSDYLILMAYDEHWSNDKPGPVASQRWYSGNLSNRFTELPPQKCFIAIGNYCYDWKAHARGATVVSFQEAIRIAQESEGDIRLDPASLNPNFDYYDENDKLHHVWFLDAVTAFNQIVEGQRYHPQGFAIWRLGSEDPSIWSILDRRTKLDRATAEILRSLPHGYDVDYQGEGEVSKASGALRDGVREIIYDEGRGLITGARVISYPSSYVITQWGGGDRKKIALTFDDGPNARFTPQVLDILCRYQVPATFFIIGLNAELNPEFLKRIMDEGHEIGNHTFTHPNITEISHWLLRLELNATERLLESRLGRCSLFFRPPYGEETYIGPDTPDQARSLLRISQLGYYTVGMGIDPNDWGTPGVDEIVNRTINQAVTEKGNIVLLHDGGGDRSQTVAALPRIIEGLRARGFELVTVSNLLGVPREAVMPPVANRERIIGRIGETGFLLFGWFGKGIYKSFYYLLIVGAALCMTRFLFVGGIAIYGWKKKKGVQYSEAYLPAASVVVPAYNEKKVISKSIRALLSSNYPNFNIIVVDDGSNDGTYQSVVDTFGHNPRVRSFGKVNGGKAHALNYGIQQTSSEIIIAMDADTILRPDTISKLVRHFADPCVGAVAGNAKVGNRTNPLTYSQALEYITSQNLDRRAFDILNCINVVPGCIGAWRRELILKAGGYTNDTLAEDADLTLKILRMGYRITYEERAVGLTEAPETVRAFLRQRFRWTYGTLQVVWKHHDVLFRSRYGALGWVAIPNILLLQIFFPVLDFLILWTLAASTAWQRYQHIASYSSDALKLLFYCGLFLGIEFLASCIALLMERREDWRLLVWQLFQRFLYRQLIYYTVLKSLLTTIHGRIVRWGKLERKATVRA
jgi:cellulose synthase/poly-beta-1,6-N-acetylglucosamine synthase-like glycosyltransferase/peptidoglycan/xylan/chitin deacetylase (PgdA/CDA1 family)